MPHLSCERFYETTGENVQLGWLWIAIGFVPQDSATGTRSEESNAAIAFEGQSEKAIASTEVAGWRPLNSSISTRARGREQRNWEVDCFFFVSERWLFELNTTSEHLVTTNSVVGIDLGTANSVVAVMKGCQPTIVTNVEGQWTTPSVVAHNKTGDSLVGQVGKRQAVVNLENTFFSAKRFIGSKMNEVDEESKQVSYTVVKDENGNVNVKLECPAMADHTQLNTLIIANCDVVKP
ncbi:chaperone protein dnaK [Striga asiatica]|uniref:Chaperone protein dnaK n=1 Tax=Striga asiatica TaxID=4170 RepID=A0A5A7QJY3_STRAF|nr:chaperone protein dnaK [Striga asiatica]